MLRFLTAGESHGPALVAILEGMPAGVRLTEDDLNIDLARRQGGFGRGGRMKIEKDRVKIVSGLRHGITIGSPIALMIPNADDRSGVDEPPLVRPRPGHADLAGGLKYGLGDMRDVLERASARETAIRCALGGVAKKLLSEFDVRVVSYVIQIGEVRAREMPASWLEKAELAEGSPVRCPDPEASQAMVAEITRAGEHGDTLGGLFEVAVLGCPPGLGSHVHWDRRLDGRLSGALMAINGIKAVEIGLGIECARLAGSQVHDEISYSPRDYYPRDGNCEGDDVPRCGYFRRTNNAGGIEGGISNGEPVVLRAAMKPIATLRRPLRSVDTTSKEVAWAQHERSDVCAVPAASVVGEAVVAMVIADAFLEKFGGDNIADIKGAYRAYLERISRF
ncbi:MAG TPA: chorismate synthase [Firmicutes bacterium]|nr:chorismate synthase [Bacillota bacterium]